MTLYNKETFFKNIDKDDAGFEANLTKKERIGAGGFGEASLVQLSAKKHKLSFVVKEYWERAGAKKTTEEAIYNYINAKKAGLKVFPTFRISSDHLKVIMTTGHTENWVCIGSNNFDKGGTLGSLGLPKIKSIKNFDKFLKIYFNQAIIASSNNIYIHTDSPFFLVERNATENAAIDFVLGDMDNVTLMETYKPPMSENLMNIKYALKKFIIDNTENPDQYIAQIEVAGNKILNPSE